MDVDTAAALRYYRAVRRFCLQAKPMTVGIVFVDVNPGDMRDITKVSQRVYGSRYEAFTVQAAAGLDQITQPLKSTRLALPTAAKVMQLKRECGFETIPAMRRDGEPVWKEYD